MMQGTAQWLLDIGLPRGGYNLIDAVHAEDFARVPGPAGLREALALGRSLVTCDQEFRGPCALGIGHAGIVVFEGRPIDEPEVVRNLRHLEFRIGQYGGALSLAGNRFRIRTDGEVVEIMPDGTEVELEPWKQVKLQVAPAMAR